jgi:hypothetical protein
MKTLFLFIVSFHLVRIVSAQCSYTTGEKVYPSTCFEKLSSDENFCLQSDCEISFVKKNENSGFLIIKVQDPNMYFINKTFVYLDDNKIITFIPTSKQWKVNYALFGQFNLTSSEIESLKKSNIRAIRFWTCTDLIYGKSFCDNASEFYNPPCIDKTSLIDQRFKEPERIGFNDIITQLFEN